MLDRCLFDVVVLFVCLLLLLLLFVCCCGCCCRSSRRNQCTLHQSTFESETTVHSAGSRWSPSPRSGLWGSLSASTNQTAKTNWRLKVIEWLFFPRHYWNCPSCKSIVQITLPNLKIEVTARLTSVFLQCPSRGVTGSVVVDYWRATLSHVVLLSVVVQAPQASTPPEQPASGPGQPAPKKPEPASDKAKVKVRDRREGAHDRGGGRGGEGREEDVNDVQAAYEFRWSILSGRVAAVPGVIVSMSDGVRVLGDWEEGYEGSVGRNRSFGVPFRARRTSLTGGPSSMLPCQGEKHPLTDPKGRRERRYVREVNYGSKPERETLEAC